MILDFQEKVISWFKQNGRDFPWRTTNDPFLITVAEILLKLTGAWKAEDAYIRLIKMHRTPESMAHANPVQLREIMQPLGLTHRAELLINLSQELITRFDGNCPDNYEELISIKGIGRYIANAVLCFAFNKKVPLVDGSVSRVFKRHFDYKSNKLAYADKELWHIASEFLPDKNFKEYNLGLLDIGAVICKHASPQCTECPIMDTCQLPKDN